MINAMKTFLVETLLINEKNIFLMNVFDLSIHSFNSDALEFLSFWKTHMYLILLFCSSSFYTYFAVFFLFSHCRLFVFVYNIGVSQHQHIWMTMMHEISFDPWRLKDRSFRCFLSYWGSILLVTKDWSFWSLRIDP